MESDNIVALYAATNLVDFAEKLGLQDDIEQITKHIDRVKNNSSDPSKILPVFVTNHLPVSLDDLALATEDVVFVGEFSGFTDCRVTVHNALHIYVMHYYEQLLRKSGIPDLGGISTQEDKATLKGIDEKERQKYIQNNYIAPTMYALQGNRYEEAKKLAADFVRFCRESELTEDAYSIAKIINENSAQQQDLLHLTFEKILAIVSQRYEAAAFVRDKIREITQPK